MIITWILLNTFLPIVSIILLCWGTSRLRNNKQRLERLQNKMEVPYGYRGIPGIGFLVHFKELNCQRKLTEMKERYGKICKVRMGSYDCVFLNDFELVKEAWNKPSFSGRPNMPGILLRTRGFKGGIVFNDGKDHTAQRRFIIQHLKNLGLGKSIMEHYILDELEDITKDIECYEGRPLSTHHMFNIASFNILWRIITGGSRFEHDDPEMSNLMTVLSRNIPELNDLARAAFFMPWLSRYFPWLTGWRKYIQDAHYLFDFWINYVKKAQLNDGPESEGFIKPYFEKISQCDDSQSNFHKSKGVISLASVLQDLYIAGSDTTATTLEWMFLYLAAFPLCQRKVAEEILQKLGSTLLVTMADKDRLPYTEAFTKEVLRFSTLAPVGMLHCTTEDVHFHGYFIPKDTIVVANACAILYDKTYWKDPHEFKPERFLSSDGKPVGADTDGFIPFSIGKRVCPGMEMAKQTLFLFLVYLVQKFEIRAAPGTKIETAPKMGVSAMPYSHQSIFVRRK